MFGSYGAKESDRCQHREKSRAVIDNFNLDRTEAEREPVRKLES